MDFKEPKKRVTKNDKKNKKLVYSQKHIRIKCELLEKRHDESVFHVHTSKPGNGVCKGS